MIVNPSDLSYDVMENPGADMSSGSGIKAAESLANMDVDKLVTGSVGPNARPILASGGIEIISNVSGNIRGALAEMGLLTETNPGEPEDAPVQEIKRNPAGLCYCPRCKYLTEKDMGGPCFKLKCPKCGNIMERKYS